MMNKILLHILALLCCGGMFAQQSYEVPVSRVTSLQPSQSGAEVRLCIDNDINTIYHSKWSQSGIPDQLNFYFSSRVKSINKIIYTPRVNEKNGIWTTVKISYSTRSNPNTFITAVNSMTLQADNTPKTITLSNGIIQPATIRIDISGAFGNFSSAAEVGFYSTQKMEPVQSECVLPTGEFNNGSDIKVSPVNGSSSSNFQPGSDIDKTLDGDLTTLYHSKWDTPNQFPINLIYKFDGQTAVDYFKYIPRQEGENGFFGNIRVSYTTSANSDYTVLTTQNLDQSRNSKTVSFPLTVKPVLLKIEVLDGKDGFASCAEMEFYRKPSATAAVMVMPALNGSSANSFQTNAGLDKSMDGDLTTLFHSKWDTPNQFPVNMVYKFNGKVGIDYLKYIPRKEGNNGFFGKVRISYTTLSNPNYTVISTYNFGQSGNAEMVNFPVMIKPVLLKIEVLDGKNGFASCAEMEFYQKERLTEVTRIQPVINGSSSSSFQANANIDKTMDGDLSTLYHSKWDTPNQFPVSLTYKFDGKTGIDYLRYIPRQSGYNGFFGNVKVSYTTLANTTYTILSTQNFGQSGTAKIISFPSTIKPVLLKIEVLDGTTGFASCAEMEFYKGNDISFDRTKVIPVVNESSASNFQANTNIDKTMDGDLTTLYHSKWDTPNHFPVNLIYKFNGKTNIDYLKYIPRQEGNNGFFGNIKISYTTLSDPNYAILLTQNLGQSGSSKIVQFPSTIKPVLLKIEVLSGKNGFASCAEMEFFQGDILNSDTAPYSFVFTDDLFTGLQSNTGQQNVNSIRSPFIKALAQCLLNSTYNKKYRVKTYEPYKTLSSINTEYKIGNYNSFENPTGILFEKNTTVVVLGKNIPLSGGVLLHIRNFANESNPEDQIYPLQNGLNTITIKNKGLGYISYYTDDPAARPVTLNITGGIVNGIFNTGETASEEWTSILENDVYPKVDIKGHYTQLLMDKDPLKEYHFTTVQPLIDKYDIITKSQREMMGFFKYNRNPKNRQFVYTESKGGYFAGGLGSHFDLTWGAHNVADAERLGIWGIAHELGHTNQIRPGIKWVGTTETTVNLYSLWAYYNLFNPSGGHKFTRLEEEESGYTAFPSVAGSRYGEFIKQTYINKKSFEESAKVGFTDAKDNNFRMLVPFWQLMLYYQLAGASKGAPSLGFDNNMSDETAVTSGNNSLASNTVDYAHWYAFVVNKSLQTDESHLTNGQLVMNFVKNTCDAVQEDLTDFFVNTGFLVPIDGVIGDYGQDRLTITESMIEEVKKYIASKRYQKPVSPYINYISANSMQIFKTKSPLAGETGIGVELESNSKGRFLKVNSSKWKNAVAFETYDQNNKLISVSITGTGDITLSKTYVDYPADALKVYAVGYDGQKILVYPSNKEMVNTMNKGANLLPAEVEDDEFSIYPNPFKNGMQLHIKMKDNVSRGEVKLFDRAGSLIYSANGTRDELKRKISLTLSEVATGMYIIVITTDKEQYQKKIIKE